MNKIILSLTVFIAIFSSCAEDSGPYVPASTGTPGHILIIMENQKWKYTPGETVRDVFDKPYEVLPQDERSFDYSHIPPEAYSSLLNKSRNILIAKISVNVKKPEVLISRNKHAKPQLMIIVKARNNDEFVKLFKKNADKIISVYTKAERDNLIKVYSTKFLEKKINKKLQEKYHINLAIPQGYTLDIDSSDFAWISRETPRSSQGILIWDYPYTDTLQLSLENLLKKRDSVTKLHVPGPADSSYMTTERLISPTFNEFILNKNYAVIIKGLWKVSGAKGVFMGGPYVEITVVDQKRERLITVDGYVYGGRKKKRELMRQVEAVLYTLKLDSVQKDNNK
ncbi:MAG: DUF4837 family protein [Chlorobi bacterium]|nr:DUF4837 family protein [Chlorobiota bacterium]